MSIFDDSWMEITPIFFPYFVSWNVSPFWSLSIHELKDFLNSVIDILCIKNTSYWSNTSGSSSIKEVILMFKALHISNAFLTSNLSKSLLLYLSAVIVLLEILVILESFWEEICNLFITTYKCDNNSYLNGRIYGYNFYFSLISIFSLSDDKCALLK